MAKVHSTVQFGPVLSPRLKAFSSFVGDAKLDEKRGGKAPREQLILVVNFARFCALSIDNQSGLGQAAKGIKFRCPFYETCLPVPSCDV